MERYQNSDLVKVGLTPPYLPLAKLPTVHERTHSTDVYTNQECENCSIFVGSLSCRSSHDHFSLCADDSFPGLPCLISYFVNVKGKNITNNA